MINPAGFSVNTSAIPPLTVSGSQVTLWEDDTNALGSFPSENNPPTSPVWVVANDLVQTDQNLRLDVQWTMSGLMNSMLGGVPPNPNPNAAIYTCTAYFELMGTGEASVNFSKTEFHKHPLTPMTPTFYNVPISIPAGSLNPGVYRLVVSITTSMTGMIGVPIVGFVDLGLIQVYKS